MRHLNLHLEFPIILGFLFLATLLSAQSPFVTTWDTENPGVTANNQIQIPGTGTNYSITWEEDGNPGNNGSATGNNTTVVTFPSPGIYNVSITPGGGSFSRINFNYLGDRRKILWVHQWGEIPWTSMQNAYEGCHNLDIDAADIPDLSLVTNCSTMFGNCINLDGPQNIGDWDMSSIEDLSNMFSSAQSFNQDIGGWDVSSVSNLFGTLSEAYSFNQNLGSWDVSSVTNMSSTFGNAFEFNQDIGDWDVSSVTNMVGMFVGAGEFDQDLSEWDVSMVTNMSNMFTWAGSFNQSLGDWNLSSVLAMFNMFDYSGMDCDHYSATLIGWNDNPATPNNKILGATERWYGSNAAPARANLTGAKGWTITGDLPLGIDCSGCVGNVTVTIIGPTESCPGETITLDAGAGFTEYYWSTGGTGQTIDISNPGTYSVTVTDADGCTGTDNHVVVALPVPNATASSNSPVCQGNTINLMSGGGVSYSWSGPNSFSSSDQNPIIPSAQPINSGTYAVTVTGGNSCTATASTSVTVNISPIASAGSNSPVCQGSTINLTASGGTSYIWNGPNGFSSNVQNPTISNAQPINSGNYSVTVTNSNGCTHSASTNVTVNVSPTATAGSNSPVCQGSIINLTSSGGTSYSWSGPNGFSSSEQNPIIFNAQPSMSGTYTVLVTDGNGCTASASADVIVNMLPVVVAFNSSPVCKGNDVDLFVSNGVDYLWSGPAGFQTNEQNPTLYDIQLSQAGSYHVTVTDVNGCSKVASTLVIVNEVVAIASATDETCNNCNDGTAIVTAIGANSYEYIWSNGEITQSIVNLAPGTYKVIVTGENGCTTTAQAVVNAFGCTTISLTPGVTDALCFGQEGQAWVNVSGGVPPYSFEWSNNETNDTITATAGTYEVVVTDADSCAATIQVMIGEPEDLIVSITTTAESCDGNCDGKALAMVTGGTLPYVWLWSNGADTSTVSDLCYGYYGVTVTDSFGCVKMIDSIIVAQGISALPLILGDTIICPGETGVLTTQGGFSSYLWTTGDTTSTINWTMEGVYGVQVTKGICTDSAEIETFISPEIILELVFVNDTLFANASGGWPPLTYLWNTNDTITYIVPQANGTYSVIVSDSIGCMINDSMMVMINVLVDSKTTLIKVYPNPVHDWLTMDFSISQEEVQLEMITLTGQQVIQDRLSRGENKLNVSSLKPGAYLLMLKENEKYYQAVFVKH